MSLDRLTVDLIRNALTYASEDMGIALRNTAYSPNIKERMDHSCALFDRSGRLIAQAEHIPVHLGSLPWGLTRTLEYLNKRPEEEIENGDMVVVNDPYIAGTHLNDITIIRPIFHNHNMIAFSANKAHHDDVGGATPGGISGTASDLLQEGLVIPPMKIMSLEKTRDDVIDLILKNSRTPKVRLGDLRAQISANIVGERRVLELVEKYGPNTLSEAIDAILDKSEVLLRKEIAKMNKVSSEAQDFLEAPDGGTVKLKVRITVKDGDELEIDYKGTDRQVPFPLNAVYGVTISGVHYVIRCLTDPTIPMNEGCFRRVSVNVPQGSVLNPNPPAPVSGGNVETSQRNADVLFLAFSKIIPEKAPAASQGTMNNVILGGIRENGERWVLYETIGGGLGARPNMDGIDGIQVHMTNAMNTPIESIEKYFPILMTAYHFRDGSGGAGKFRGGDGIERGYMITKGKATTTLLAERVRFRPWGLQGGKGGYTGKHSVIRKTGKTEDLNGKCTLTLNEGDILLVRTPGGGGYGRKKKNSAA